MSARHATPRLRGFDAFLAGTRCRRRWREPEGWVSAEHHEIGIRLEGPHAALYRLWSERRRAFACVTDAPGNPPLYYLPRARGRARLHLAPRPVRTRQP